MLLRALITCSLLIGSAAAVRAEETTTAGSATVKLGEDNLTSENCTIVLSSTASKCEVYAAEELKKYIRRIAGVDLPVKTDQEEINGRMILVGNSKKLKDLGVTIDFADLGEEGFVIKTVGGHLVLAGGRERGTLYGVYTLLEEYLGCGWFMPAGPLGEVVPSSGAFSLAGIDRTEKPSFQWRALSGISDCAWLAKNKLDPSRIGSRFGKDKGDPAVFGSSGHIFDRLVPPKKYFISHPEYFALVKGKRQWDGGQICTSNPEVIKICAEAIIKQMDEKPDCKIFSLCQDDGYGWCECEKCKALDVDENLMTDRLLKFANAVAKLVYEKHPDKYIYTYAYTSKNQDPPKAEGLKPAKNLIVQTTHYSPCCHSHPIATCERNEKFNSQVERWTKLCDAFYIYDYRVDYRHYLMPYPNCYAVARDIPYYKRLGVKGLYYQGGGAFNHGPCHYLIAKLAWNADADVDALIDRFFERYYGRAGVPMKAWFRLLHEKMWNENICVHLYSNPPEKLFTPELLKEADEYFNEAEQLAENQIIRDRVDRERLTLYYVKLATGRNAKTIKNKTGCYHGEHGGGEDAWRKDLARFIRLAEKHGVWQITESFGGGVKFIRSFVEQVSGMTVHDKADFRWLSGSAPKSEKKCIYIRGGIPGYHGGWSQNRVLLKPKTTYTLRAWIKVKDVKDVKVRTLHVASPISCFGPEIKGTQDWTLVETTFTTLDVPSLSISVFPALLSNEGEVWIDDVSLTASGAAEDNLIKNPGFEKSYGKTAKDWHYPANRLFSWMEFSPVKDFLKDPEGYKIR